MKKLSILVISLLFVGCGAKDAPQFPTIEYVYEIDAKNNLCGQFKVESLTPFKIKWEKDIPMSECDGQISLSVRDMQKVLNFKKDAEDWFNTHKQCLN